MSSLLFFWVECYCCCCRTFFVTALRRAGRGEIPRRWEKKHATCFECWRILESRKKTRNNQSSKIASSCGGQEKTRFSGSFVRAHFQIIRFRQTHFYIGQIAAMFLPANSTNRRQKKLRCLTTLRSWESSSQRNCTNFGVGPTTRVFFRLEYLLSR